MTIEAHEADGGVAIEVSDEGPGLAAEPDELLAGPAGRPDMAPLRFVQRIRRRYGPTAHIAKPAAGKTPVEVPLPKAERSASTSTKPTKSRPGSSRC